MTVFIFLVLLAVRTTEGNKEIPTIPNLKPCTLYEMVRAISTCAIQWRQANTFLKASDLINPKVEKAVHQILEDTEIPSAIIYVIAEVQDHLNMTMSELVELSMVLEPSLAYVVADLILGQRITPEELEVFELPAELSQKNHLKAMYREYYHLTCKA